VTATADFGPCCGCGKPHDATVRNVLYLDFEAPPGFCGWGCFVCGLEFRGALAIMCDACLVQPGVAPKFIAGGRCLTDKLRVALEGYQRRPFGHIHARHPGITIH
jgi:hypothetical protein